MLSHAVQLLQVRRPSDAGMGVSAARRAGRSSREGDHVMSAVAVGIINNVAAAGPDAGDEAMPVATEKKRGGGPRTPEGRLRCSKNSTKEGLRARGPIDEDETEAIAT